MISKICKICHKEKTINLFPKNRNTCKECYRPLETERNKKYKESKNLQAKEYYQKNKIKSANKNKKWRENNKEKILILGRDYQKRKCRTDENFRIKKNLRVRINSALKSKNSTKLLTTMELLGCTIEEFKTYLESKFTVGMDWDNYGKFGWHIDHIKPCVSFNLTDFEEQKKCFHFSNLQPLWWYDNIKKFIS